MSFFRVYPVLDDIRFVVDPFVTKATFGEYIPPLPTPPGTELGITIREGREGSEV
jgi:hypothetical protein